MVPVAVESWRRYKARMSVAFGPQRRNWSLGGKENDEMCGLAQQPIIQIIFDSARQASWTENHPIRSSAIVRTVNCESGPAPSRGPGGLPFRLMTCSPRENVWNSLSQHLLTKNHPSQQQGR